MTGWVSTPLGALDFLLNIRRVLGRQSEWRALREARRLERVAPAGQRSIQARSESAYNLTCMPVTSQLGSIEFEGAARS